MYVSRLAFHTVPGRTEEVVTGLGELTRMVSAAGGTQVRVLRNHLASLGAPDVVFEQEAADLADLEAQIHQVAESAEFKDWSKTMSPCLAESPKREIYIVASDQSTT